VYLVYIKAESIDEKTELLGDLGLGDRFNNLLVIGKKIIKAQ
jgi:hypothetical protein